ncbi:hypothetical protein CLU79DRAFT_839256 [Phycomyces nitens]|nr:hypothetical protein CLU79DRAFT_839256 [Phycomyces nitens]
MDHPDTPSPPSPLSRNYNGVTGPSLTGLPLNKQGHSIMKSPSNRHAIRIANLPPLNLSRKSSLEYNYTSHSPSYATSAILSSRSMSTDTHPQVTEPNSSNNKLFEACQNVSFLSTLIHITLYKCLDFCVNDKLTGTLASSLQNSRSCTDKLAMVLHQIDYQMVRQASPSPAFEVDLVKVAKACITSLRELCRRVKECLGLFVHILDPKHARNMVMNLHCATVDLKEAWEMIVSLPLPVHTLSLQPTLSAPTDFHSTTKYHPSLPRARSASEHHAASPAMSPLASPCTAEDSTQLFGHLKLAVTGSLHVVDLLNISIEAATGPDTLKQKLHSLSRQAQQAVDMALCLDKSLENIMTKGNGLGMNSLFTSSTSQLPNIVSPPSPSLHKDSSRKLWEDTTAYLKSILSVMSSIRSISTEEDFAWPKAVKQGCLHVTRVTAEVAKLWNNYSIFAKHGYYLGKGDNVSKQHATHRSMSGIDTSQAYASSSFEPTSTMRRHKSQTSYGMRSMSNKTES